MALNTFSLDHSPFYTPPVVAPDPVSATTRAARTLRTAAGSVTRIWRLSKWRRQAARDAKCFSSIPYDVLKDLYVVRYGALNHAA